MSDIVTPIGTKKEEIIDEVIKEITEDIIIYKVELMMDNTTLPIFLEQTGAKGVVYYPVKQS